MFQKVGNKRLDVLTPDTSHIQWHTLVNKIPMQLPSSANIGFESFGAKVFGPKMAAEGVDVDDEVTGCFNSRGGGLMHDYTSHRTFRRCSVMRCATVVRQAFSSYLL